MRAGHLWLASFLGYLLVGAPLVAARAFRDFGFPARAVLSGGVGMVIVSGTMTVFALFGLHWGPTVLLVSVALSAALGLLLPRSDAVPAPAPAEERSGDRAIVPIAWAITAVSVFAALAATLAGASTSVDLILFWGPKAQQFATARTIDAGFLGAPFLEYLHVYYPPLVTNVFALGAMAAGRFPWGAATLTFPLLLAATAIGLAGILKSRSGTGPSAAVAALVTSGLALVGIRALVPGNAEPFLLFFEILAVALLMTPAAATTGGKLLAGLFLAGAATSKVEGLPFVVAAAVLFALVERESFRRTIHTAALLLGPTVLSLGAWLAFGEIHHLFHGYRGYGEVLAPQWHRLPGITATIGAALWKSGYALPWLIPLAVLLLSGRKERGVILPIGIATLLSGFLVFTYLTTLGDPTQLIYWSATRVVSPVSALFGLAVLASPGPRRDIQPPSPG